MLMIEYGIECRQQEDTFKDRRADVYDCEALKHHRDCGKQGQELSLPLKQPQAPASPNARAKNFFSHLQLTSRRWPLM
jgi:hypothetical protein